MIEKLKEHYLNFKGWRTNSKIIVFESDDWGSIRMPSVGAYKTLLESGIRVDQSRYNSHDCLENREDFTLLLDLLEKFKDERMRHPIFTMNTVMANPDFEKIKELNFEKYEYRSFLDSYYFYYQEQLEDLWGTGLTQKLIRHLKLIKSDVIYFLLIFSSVILGSACEQGGKVITKQQVATR